MPEQPQFSLPPSEAQVEAWCRAASAGDSEAVEALLGTHHERLLALAARKIGVDWNGKIDAEDVLQDAYMEVFRSISTFTYQGEESFYRWAARIVDHRFIDQVRGLRRKKRDAARELGQAGRGSTRHESLLDACLGREATASRIVRRQDAVGAMLVAMARLPEDYRQLLQRMYLDEEPIADVARDMGKTEDAVRRMAGRAAEKLQALMGHASRYISGIG